MGKRTSSSENRCNLRSISVLSSTALFRVIVLMFCSRSCCRGLFAFSYRSSFPLVHTSNSFNRNTNRNYGKRNISSGEYSHDEVKSSIFSSRVHHRSNFPSRMEMTTGKNSMTSKTSNTEDDEDNKPEKKEEKNKEGCTNQNNNVQRLHNNSSNNISKSNKQNPPINYSQNPSITSTALAHNLWKSILRPNLDSAIDATCGNGHDSAAIANILFPSSSEQCVGDDQFGENNNSQSSNNNNLSSSSAGSNNLVCVDVQLSACENTRSRLMKVLPPKIFQNHVTIYQTSHFPLPNKIGRGNNNGHGNNDEEDGLRNRRLSSVALIVYNLGYLPNTKRNTKNKNDNDGDQKAEEEQIIQTKTETTLSSIADAMLLLRVGGMLSIMTYPKTNKQESDAVRVFVEATAIFTSNELNWETFVHDHFQHQKQQQQASSIDNGANDGDDTSSSIDSSTKKNDDQKIEIKIQLELRRLKNDGEPMQTWRVYEHKQLGRPVSPILLTATRIK